MEVTGNRNSVTLKGKRLSPMSYGKAAHLLGCTKPHLWLVLNGHRISKSLLERYETLIGNLNKK